MEDEDDWNNQAAIMRAAWRGARPVATPRAEEEVDAFGTRSAPVAHPCSRLHSPESCPPQEECSDGYSLDPLPACCSIA